MSSRESPRACWRCVYWDGFADAAAIHSRCSRLNASPVQASPADGCASWEPGAGDDLHPGWMPVGFKAWDGPRIHGKPLAHDASASPRRTERPCLPSEQFEFDQKAAALAWRLADELVDRARRSAR